MHLSVVLNRCPGNRGLLGIEPHHLHGACLQGQRGAAPGKCKRSRQVNDVPDHWLLCIPEPPVIPAATRVLAIGHPPLHCQAIVLHVVLPTLQHEQIR